MASGASVPAWWWNMVVAGGTKSTTTIPSTPASTATGAPTTWPAGQLVPYINPVPAAPASLTPLPIPELVTYTPPASTPEGSGQPTGVTSGSAPMGAAPSSASQPSPTPVGAIVAGTLTINPSMLTPPAGKAQVTPNAPRDRFADAPLVISGVLNVTSGFGSRALSGTTKLSIPFLFGLLALVVLAVQIRAGRRDPKLAEAPVSTDEHCIAFE